MVFEEGKILRFNCWIFQEKAFEVDAFQQKVR